ncbi:MAG TPA: FAD-dependent oxidoreductase [Terriglobia bacterium]|nr:FAD-dependent oxidoreductase [Terriglobia bacterium]
MTPPVHHAVLRRVWGSSSRARHFEFQMANGQRFKFHAGQYISLHTHLNGEGVARAYSIAARQADDRLELCVNVSSGEDAWLLGLKRDEEVEFSGPFGSFELRHPPGLVAAFIATGTGIAPIRAMIQELYRKYKPEEVWLIFGVRREADILYREEFEKLARVHPEFRFVPTLSRPDPGWMGRRGYVQEQIKKYLRGKEGLQAYVCGSPAMVEQVRALLQTMGYDDDAVSFERFE